MAKPTNNFQRTAVAREALECVEDNGDIGDNLTDLLANLMHLAQYEGLDFDKHVRLARMHYEAEK